MCFAEEYPEETELISFNKMEERGVTGRADDGVIVFVDRFMNVDVKLGETWHCRLHRNMTGLSQYYLAWPISKVETIKPKTEPIPVQAKETETFTALGNDRIFSEKLREGTYIAYRSMNGAWLQLKPSEKGNIRCRDNSISIEGLDEFVCGQLPRSLDFISAEDSFLIKLEE